MTGTTRAVVKSQFLTYQQVTTGRRTKEKEARKEAEQGNQKEQTTAGPQGEGGMQWKSGEWDLILPLPG